MSITFRCTSCGKKLAAKETSAGKLKTCPQCGSKVTVPGPKGSPRPRSSADRKRERDDEAALLMKPSTQHGDLIDMTAMVDIVFFLLIFFMVTSLQSVEAVIGLPTPQQQEGVANNVQAVPDYANDDHYITVTIDADDTIWVEDQEATSEQDLRAKLRAARRESDEREGLFVSCSPESTHGTFVSVLDAGADSGFKDLKFSVTAAEESTSGG